MKLDPEPGKNVLDSCSNFHIHRFRYRYAHPPIQPLTDTTSFPNEHFERFLIGCISSNYPRPLRAIEHIARTLSSVLNLSFSTWHIECMPQSYGHEPTRYNFLCHALRPCLENRVEVEFWDFKFQVIANIVRKCMKSTSKTLS